MEDLWGYDNDNEILVVKAPMDLAAGAEVRLPFGEKCNSELIDFYGYYLDENENDCVHMDLTISKTDPLWSQKNLLYTAARIE